MSSDGLSAYVVSGDRSAGLLSVIDLTTRQVAAKIPVPAAARQVAISEDGTRAYVTAGGRKGRIAVVDLVARGHDRGDRHALPLPTRSRSRLARRARTSPGAQNRFAVVDLAQIARTRTVRVGALAGRPRGRPPAKPRLRDEPRRQVGQRCQPGQRPGRTHLQGSPPGRRHRPARRRVAGGRRAGQQALAQAVRAPHAHAAAGSSGSRPGAGPVTSHSPPTTRASTSPTAAAARSRSRAATASGGCRGACASGGGSSRSPCSRAARCCSARRGRTGSRATAPAT